MKKTVSIFMIITIILSSLLAVIPVSAATEGTAINSAAEFLSMDANGSYYLACNLTLSESYAADFKGNLDGNGRTLTLEGVPSAFESIMGGSVKNLRLSVKYSLSSNADVGALSRRASGSFENIHATVDYASPSHVGAFKKAMGGIIGRVDGETDIRNCSVEGSLSLQAAVSGSSSIRYGVGGIVGVVENAGLVDVYGCVNRASVSSRQYATSNGGIIGIFFGDTQITVKDCRNYGEIFGTSGAHAGTAGICGVADGTKEPSSWAVFEGCRNYANVSDQKNPASSSSSNNHVGGIVGRSYGMPQIIFTDCINSGDISSVGGGWASSGGIFGGDMTHGYDWSGSHPGTISLTNCINVGNVKGGSFAGGIGGGVLQHSVNGCKLELGGCSNFGTVVGISYAGGMVGNCGEEGFNGLNAVNCYNAGDVRSGVNAGGIIGYINNSESDKNNQITDYLPINIENCLNEGHIVSANQHLEENKYAAAGILANTTREATIKNCVNIGYIERIRDNVRSVANITPEYLVQNQAEGNLCYADSPIPLNSYVMGADRETVDARAKEIIALAAPDFRYAEQLIAKGENYKEHLVVSGWEAMQNAISEAKGILSRPVSHGALEALEESLEEAIYDVRFVGTPDKSALKELAGRAKSYIENEREYTSDSFRTFRLAYAKAQAVRALEKPTYLDVDKAHRELLAAINALTVKADAADIERTLEEYSAYNSELYTAQSWHNLSVALSNLEALLEKNEISEAQAQEAILSVKEAEKNLLKRGDGAALEAKINEIEKKYPRESYTASSYYILRVALQRARSLFASDNLSEEEVSLLKAEIDEAAAALEGRGDAHKLNLMIAQIQRERYTEDSLKDFDAVVAEIKAACSNENIGNLSEGDVAEFVKMLEAAAAKLSLKNDDVTDGENDGENEQESGATDGNQDKSDGESTDKDEKKTNSANNGAGAGTVTVKNGCNSDISGVAVSVALVLGLVCLAATTKKQTKKE